ncbi:MAG TPA: signal peptidase I [Candidatus Saccharimonadales bacterium]|jgi:signal peptidase I
MNPNKQSTISPSPPPEPSTPVTNEAPKSSRRQGLRDALSVIAVLLAALLLAWGLISFVFQSYEVEGPSMQSTLHDKDHLVVWKVARTWARVTGHQYVPNRGDIIVFNEPNLADFGQSADKQLIKRVIGLPGDRVVVKNGVVTIYNKAHPKGFDPDKTLAYGKGKNWPITSGNIDITLKSNQIFVCGDNRTDSLDSRIFGPVNINNIVGKLAIRVLPLNDAKVF